MIALAIIVSACGPPSTDFTAATSTPPDAAAVLLEDPTTTTSNVSVTATDQTIVVTEAPVTASWDHRHVAIYGNYATESSSAIRYLVASSNTLDELIDESWSDIRFELPFGVKVSHGQIDISGGPNRPAPRVLWPVSCLGVAPDIDGDALLDDCDPYPADGPLADWDGDGVVNPEDNCPTVSNPDQTAIHDRSSGAACDPREGVGPEVWVVIPSITIANWNVVREERGLEALSMPTGPAPLPPEVAAWCGSASAEDTTESVRALADEIPDVYGLTIDQERRLATLSVELSDLLDRYEVMQSDPQTVAEDAGSVSEAGARFTEIEQQLQGVRAELAPYIAPLFDSDLACHLDR